MTGSPPYDDGINELRDYLGCIVKICRDLVTPSGSELREGSTYLVREASNGRLTLSNRTQTLGGHGSVAARAVRPVDVEVIGWRLA
jgi:hypothetical protein